MAGDATHVLLFGPQALSFQEDSFRRLRSDILDHTENHWIRETVAQLPSYLDRFLQSFPKYRNGPGVKLLGDLETWLDNGSIPAASSRLPNVILSPLVVLSQLTQYTEYRQILSSGDATSYNLDSRQHEIVGFCTGLLSALAVSSSSSKDQFQQYGAAAVRLAALVGVIVDAEDSLNKHGQSKSLAVVWNSARTKAELTKLLEKHSEAYISVDYDENRATVTTSSNTSDSLREKLRAAGLIAAEVGLRGRFHYQQHQESAEALLDFCEKEPGLQFPEALEAGLPIRSGSGEIISQGKLHHAALRSILLEQAQWYQTFSAVQSAQKQDDSSIYVSFGLENCVPPSYMKTLGSRVIHMNDNGEARSRLKSITIQAPAAYSENDIAVVGMSVKVAGADDVEEFWDVLGKGESQHIEVPKERFTFETQYREEDKKRKWYGNFVRDHDTFDHKFFKKSPREVTSQDPQQRLMLQSAYQAVEQSGYFNTSGVDKHIGCFIGVCSIDYEKNAAMHAPTAFTSTGTLQSFIAGKISHYFGWTGPGYTIDTACSASAAAIHQACRAILHGECTAALAGGVTVMTSPIGFQNLAGATFLSPTGACKPFDAKADGYCRGEGIASVFLKKMSKAVADGDQILGSIRGTAVHQNQNHTPIFVPNSPSLSSLFEEVTKQAKVGPADVTVVEAHGTGTPVGDPVEYESVLRVLGGSKRLAPIALGSVKGHFGHTESASGAVALIKMLCMIQEAAIPPQASFQTLSPKVKASPSDNIEINTGTRKEWKSENRVALINNYGASGSNASLVVGQSLQHTGAGKSLVHSARIEHPFWICGYDARSIKQYSIRLKSFIESKRISASNVSVANLSFNVSRQSNRSLDNGLIFKASSILELENVLDKFIQGDKALQVTPHKKVRSVVLCFGGQISTFIGLDQKVFEGVNVLRNYLNKCDSILKSAGHSSLYPDIFQKTPVQDTVKLQTMLFAMQYSCAKSWIDCGVQVAAVVGHSFGELTAACISGVVSLEDSLRTVAARAKLIQEAWASDKGAMLAVSADLDDVHGLLAHGNGLAKDDPPATIACYNGSRSFTLAGSNKAIDAVLKGVANFPKMRVKKLNVTNAFHSTLVEPLMDRLRLLAKDVKFKEPVIPWERATESKSTESITADFYADHMRNPVYFNHALQRLSKRFSSCIWLEAGSNSTLTEMASKALEASTDYHFQSVNITNDSGLQNLVDITTNLWKEGLRVSFWAHHKSQTYDYAPLILPPYQFEKSKHWLELKKPVRAIVEAAPQPQIQQKEELPTELYTFVGYQDDNKSSAKFRINTMIKKYEDFISGHLIAHTAPICPATLEVDIAVEALRSLRPDFVASKLQPEIHTVENKAPICVDPAQAVWLDLKPIDADSHVWSWQMTSTSASGSTSTVHVEGKIVLRSVDDQQVHAEFARYERLTGHQRCTNILDGQDADDIIQGRNIYKTFAEIVDYGVPYRGLQKLVGKGMESAGKVVKQHSGETWLDTHLSDCFSQVGGIWVNCMTERASTDMYIANGFEKWMRSPSYSKLDGKTSAWDVYAYHQVESDKAYTTDIFIFEADTGALTEVILGINYAKINKASMSKILTRLTATSAIAAAPSASVKVAPPPVKEAAAPSTTAKAPALAKASAPKKLKKESTKPDVAKIVIASLAELSGLEAEAIKIDTELANIGIDSLMGMELASDLEGRFKCSLPEEQLSEVTTTRGLVQCVEGALKLDGSDEDEEEVADESDESELSTTSPSQSDSEMTDSRTSVGSESRVNLAAYLADFLGVDEGEIKPEVRLIELGVDSLLGSELHGDLAGKFDVHLSEDIALEELSVSDLDAKINGRAESAPKPSATPAVTPAPITQKPVDMPSSADNSTLDRTIDAKPSGEDLKLKSSTVLEAFGETKKLTDQFISDYRCAGYMDNINPKQTQLCVVLALDAFEQLGCNLRTAQPGQQLEKIKYLPQHNRLVEYLYDMLETGARLIDVSGSDIKRTAIAAPTKSSKDILESLLKNYPDHEWANKLTNFCGTRLADVLTGKSDGIKLIFGSEEGRNLVSGLYGDSLLNKLAYKQMEDFLKRLVSRIPKNSGPLRILEMGAGTGGTTQYLVPLLASLNVPVEYTFTDLAPSFVAAARKRFKQYPFLKYRAHDIEKPPPDELIGTQHMVVASNAVHATHSLPDSTSNIKKFLRPDGFLMMLEMTETVYWIDIIFGLLEGWWLFDDGRRHAISHQSHWEKELQSVGYGHVDWTDGERPENRIQKIFIAMASGQRYDRLPISPRASVTATTDSAARQVAVDEYVQRSSHGFAVPAQSNRATPASDSGSCVLITGATGSLGSHLVEHFAKTLEVRTVVCLNRPNSKSEASTRQREAMESRGIKMEEKAYSKLRVLEADTSKPNLGVPSGEYDFLVNNVTHVLHNAWPMSGARPVKGFELQFRVLRNLIDLASATAGKRSKGSKISFQFISSIATVGHYPLWSGDVNVPEERVEIGSVLPNGYGDAKFICEKVLDETLHKYPDIFRTMSVRLGQVAGSKTSGYWNPQEHLSFLVKSSQTLKSLPGFTGLLSWTPVNDVADTLGDLLLADNTPYPIYHIDNPVRQPWTDMIPVLGEALSIPQKNVIPFDEWVSRVRNFPGSVEKDNPAAKLIDFLDYNFLRMSCGGLLLDTSKSREHSRTLAKEGPVSYEVAKKYVQAWKDMGFLHK